MRAPAAVGADSSEASRVEQIIDKFKHALVDVDPTLWE
jgi:hypothetical protein